jgi:chromosome segregation ATPase
VYKKIAIQLGISAETASAAFDVASWTLLVAFVVGGMAAIVIVFTSFDKEHQWDSLREQSRARIVELELETAKANTELRKANADIASANASMAEARKRIAAFERDAADARELAAAANGRAADAEKRAAEASLEVEKYKSPRTLSSQQLARMTERLKRFEKTPFDFSLTPDSEAISLMGEIAKVLTDSGWEWRGLPVLLVSKRTGELYPRMGASSGVQIQVDERKKQEWEKPALELRDALKGAGIEATAEAIKAGGVSDNAIHIRIGRAR